MDDHFSEDLLNINLDAETFQRLVDDIRNDSARQMNVQPVNSFRTRLLQIVLASPEYESSQSEQISTNLRSSELTSTTEAFSQNQGHLQRSSTYGMHQTPRFQTEEAAFIASREVSPSEAVLHTDFASAASRHHMQDQSHGQKVCSYATPFRPPLPHTSISIPNPPPCMIPEQQKPSSKNGHIQRSSTYDMHQTPYFQTEEAAFIASREVSSSEAVIHTDFASAASHHHMQDQSHGQKFCSYATPFRPPLPHTSISIPNPPPCMIPEQQKPSSKNSLVDRLTEPNPRQFSLEEMEKLINTFRITRNMLGFSREDVTLVLPNLSDKYISQNTLTKFERFRKIFEDMCDLKFKIESVLEDFQSSRTTSYSVMNMSESIVPGLPTEAVIGTTQQQNLGNVFLQNSKPEAERFATKNFNSGVHGAVSYYGPENYTGEVPDVRIPEEAINNSENGRLLSQLPRSQPKKKMSLEELLRSIETLRERRLVLNLTQKDVRNELNKRCNPPIPLTSISHFETFSVFLEEMRCLKLAMEEWLKDIHISETQSRISPLTKIVLTDSFDENPTPDAKKISFFAKLVNLDHEFVKIWFQKYRQIKEYTNSRTDSYSEFPVRHPHRKPQH